MTTLTEAYHDWSFVLSEANGSRSRENGVLLTGTASSVGAGQILQYSAGTVASAAWVGNTGNGAMGTVTPGVAAQVGTYEVEVYESQSNAGLIEVRDPAGVIVGHGTVGVAFLAGDLGFTLADGATDFHAGDGFDLDVTEGVAPFASGGRVAGIAGSAVDATAADQPIAYLARDAEVDGKVLTYPTSTAAAEVNAKLGALGIRVR
jgi:Bacteriophage lambda head decoration protein D